MRRIGLTVLELVVVIAILGILIALLLPVVMFARESARRTACASNLHQLSLAVQNYEALHRQMPPLWQGKNWSVHVALLPQLDQGELLNRVDIWKEFGVNGGELARQILPVLHCPSDGETMPYLGWGAGTNYAANMGVNVGRRGYNGGLSPPHISTWFPQFPVGQITTSAISDGLSETALFAEVLAGRRESPDFRRLFLMTEREYQLAEYDEFCSACRNHEFRQGSDGSLVQHEVRGRPWTGGWPNTVYTHDMQPHEPSCMGMAIGVLNTSSGHSKGVQVAFCDGHVQFVSNTVHPKTWRGFGSRDGSEVLTVP